MDFKDLKIVEIASVLAGPSVGMFFAELGAQVIKVEPKPIGGDVTRTWKLASETGGSNVSAYFAAANYKKDYYFFDFNNEEEHAKTLTLIKSADILICNFKKGDDIKFGFDYSTLKKWNSKLIYAAISGFGSDSDRVAYDLILQAESGFMSMNGTIDSGPVKMPVALIDILAAHQLKEGILIALLKHRQKGALVTVSLYDAAICSLANQASNYLMAGHVAERIGSLHPNIAPYGEQFTTSDNSTITFAIGNDKQFTKLMMFLGLENMISSPKYSNNSNRVVYRKELTAILSEKIIQFSSKEILEYCLANYIPAAKIKNIREVFEAPEAKHLVLEEEIEKVPTARVKTVAFKILPGDI